MPITPPVTDTELSTSGWGIPITNEVNRMTPIVDGSIRQGFMRIGAGLTATVSWGYWALPTLVESAGATWTPDGLTSQFTCPVAGVYSLNATAFVGNTIPQSSSFIGIHVDGAMKARYYMTHASAAYCTYNCAVTMPLNVGQKIGLVVSSGTGTLVYGNVAYPGLATDSPAPMLSAWRISV